MRRSLLLLQYYDNNKRLGAELLKEEKRISFLFFIPVEPNQVMDSEGLAQEAVPHTSGSRETWRAYLYIMGQSIIKTELSRKQSNSRYGQASNRWKQWFSLRASRVRSVFPEANAITTARESRCHRFPRLVRLYLGAQLSRVSFSPRSIHAPAFLQSKHRRQEERTREKVF